MPDAQVIPIGDGGRLSPSKAARLVGNTGPQPVPAAVRVPEHALPVEFASLPENLRAFAEEAWEFVQRRRSGDYEIDEFGFDPDLTEHVLMALVRPLYRSWFRVESSGLENIPADSGALVVANHSGTVAFDSVMTQVALLDDHPAHRHLRMLGANLVFQTPFLGEI
ncbi:MAG: 1-acyl-sn-glycerol-3-phosphate acyltransferase, partial [Candidatus Nanopelagicales bacterium]